MKSKADYEYAIRNTILFEYDKGSSAYKREELKLIENLYCYLVSINKDKYTELGLEITETAKKCINNYKPEFGEFIHYFNKAISREFRKVSSVNRINESHCGIHIPENDLRIIKKYLRYTENISDSEIKNATLDALECMTGLSRDKIKQCINDFHNSGTISDVQYSDDDEISLFDTRSSGDDIENDFEQKEIAEELLKRIDSIFSSRQERQKKMLSMLITSKISERLVSDNTLLSVARQLSFFNEKIFDEYLSNQVSMTSREIAAELGISEQSISRAYKNFVLLLQ